jgi:hypothetical protein
VALVRGDWREASPCGIHVKLGDPVKGYAAIGKASRMAEAVGWLKDRACQQYPDSEFARKYGAFV